MCPQFALDEGGNVVAAVDCEKRVAPPEYTCPSCYGDMSLAGGPRTQFVKHFRHTGKSCFEYPNRHSPGEHHDTSQETIVRDLENAPWASGVEKEYYTGNRRADVFFRSDGVEYAVEIQASGLSAEKLRERTRDHTDAGVHTLWLFHDSLYDDAPLDETRPEFLTTQQGWFSMLVEEGGTDVWMPLYGPTQVTMGILGNAWHIYLYEDMNAGRPSRTTATNRPTPFTSRGGLKLAAGEKTLRSFGDIASGPESEASGHSDDGRQQGFAEGFKA